MLKCQAISIMILTVYTVTFLQSFNVKIWSFTQLKKKKKEVFFFSTSFLSKYTFWKSQARLNIAYIWYIWFRTDNPRNICFIFFIIVQYFIWNHFRTSTDLCEATREITSCRLCSDHINYVLSVCSCFNVPPARLSTTFLIYQYLVCLLIRYWFLFI